MNAIILAERLHEMEEQAELYKDRADNYRKRSQAQAQSEFGNLSAVYASRANYYRGLAQGLTEAVAMIKGQPVT